MAVPELTEALRLVVTDPWNTRAWILQEAFASSGNMVLLFPKAEGVNLNGWTLVCHEISLTEIAIRLDILQLCLRKSAEILQPSSLSRAVRGEKQWRKTVEQVRWFHPGRPEHFGNFLARHDKPRRMCNAAVALSFLKSRHNSRVVDRVAIIANLCGYDYRLSTIELEASQESLGACILALSIKNGDHSLLIPELYKGLPPINSGK